MTNSCIPIFAPLVKNKTRFLQVKITLVPKNIMKYRKLTKTSEISRCFRYLEIIVSRIFSSHCPRFPLWLCLFRKPGFGHCYKHHAKHEELPVSAVICKGARRHLWMPETHINPFSGKYLIRKPLKTMGSVGLGGWQQFQGASELSSLLETDFWRALAQQTTFLGVRGIQMCESWWSAWAGDIKSSPESPGVSCSLFCWATQKLMEKGNNEMKSEHFLTFWMLWFIFTVWAVVAYKVL